MTHLVSNLDPTRLPFRERRPRAGVRLLCFPFAGGSAAMYRTWSRGLPESIEVVPVELPGHGVRAKEAPIARWPALVDDVFASIRPLLDRPLALFGYSMGAKLAFEVACRLSRTRGECPLQLFVAASRAPTCPGERRRTSALPRAEFLAELDRMGGTPPAVLEMLASTDLADALLPLLRNDFALAETYTYGGQPPLACPIAAFRGTHDTTAPMDSVGAWARHTAVGMRMSTFEEGHFFHESRRAEILAVIAEELSARQNELLPDFLVGSSS